MYMEIFDLPAMSVEILKFGISISHTIAIKIAVDVTVKQVEKWRCTHGNTWH